MDVTIIIPTYNRLWSLPKAIESCRTTSLKTEIIVIDDGSTDETASWLKDQADVIKLSQYNWGKDWAVNSGLSMAKGKYIRFLDSDDWFPANSTDLLFKCAEDNNADVICAGHQVFDENENYLRDIPWTVCDDFLAQQLGECDSSHYSAYLFKKDFIKDIPHRPEYGARDDRQFIIEVALKNPKTDHIDQPALAHRVHSKEKLQSVNGLKESLNNLATLTIYKKCFTILENEGRLTMRYKKAALNTLWHLSNWVAKTNLTEAKEIYKWILELDPGYTVSEKGVIGFLYRKAGFSATQKMLKIRRILKYGLQ